jgi:hypothetical protein
VGGDMRPRPQEHDAGMHPGSNVGSRVPQPRREMSNFSNAYLLRMKQAIYFVQFLAKRKVSRPVTTVYTAL